MPSPMTRVRDAESTAEQVLMTTTPRSSPRTTRSPPPMVVKRMPGHCMSPPQPQPAMLLQRRRDTSPTSSPAPSPSQTPTLPVALPKVHVLPVNLKIERLVSPGGPVSPGNCQHDLSGSPKSWFAHHASKVECRGSGEYPTGAQDKLSASHKSGQSPKTPNLTARRTSEDGRAVQDDLSASQRSSRNAHSPSGTGHGYPDELSQSQRSVVSRFVVAGLASTPERCVPRDVCQRKRSASPLVQCNGFGSVSQEKYGRQGEVTVTRNIVVAPPAAPDTLQQELQELKTILESQSVQQRQLDAMLQPLAASSEEQRAMLQAQIVQKEQRVNLQTELVQKVVSVAPESRVKELCAMVACQQAKQDILLQNLRANMDLVQQQMQIIMSSAPEKQIHSFGSLKHEPKDMEPKEVAECLTQDVKGDLAEVEKKNDDTEAKQRSSVISSEAKQIIEGMQNRIVNDMKGWIAEFFVSAMKETVGLELQKHEQDLQDQDKALKFLETNITDTNENVQRCVQAIQMLVRDSLPTSPEVEIEAVQGPQSTGEAALRQQGEMAPLPTINEADVESWAKAIYIDATSRAQSALQENGSAQGSLQDSGELLIPDHEAT